MKQIISMSWMNQLVKNLIILGPLHPIMCLLVTSMILYFVLCSCDSGQ